MSINAIQKRSGMGFDRSGMILLAASIAGCSKKVARTPEPRPVRTVTVDELADGETVSFTGQIRAKGQVNLAFRLDGRVIERNAGVGEELLRQAKLSPGSTSERTERAALKPRPSSHRRGAADPGAACFWPAAGAAEERLDAACQVRRRPGGAAHGRSAGRLGPGAVAHRSDRLEL